MRVTRKQLNDHIDRLAASYNLPPDQVHKAYEQPGTMEHLESQIKTRGVLDLLLEQARIEEVEGEAAQIDKE